MIFSSQNTQKIFSLLMVLCFSASLFSQEVFAEKRTLIATAYYSPLPNQKYYLRGSYEGDIKLNGKGVSGASGKSVYAGMIAAPKTYSFGTKIIIPWLGTGSVEDRGGAIVSAGEWGNSYDRIDIWMGYGDEGLRRALAWGKKTINVEVLSASEFGSLLGKSEGISLVWLPLSAQKVLATTESIKTSSGTIKPTMSGTIASHTASGATSSGTVKWTTSILASSAAVKIAANISSALGSSKKLTNQESIIFQDGITSKTTDAQMEVFSKILMSLGYLSGTPQKNYTAEIRMAIIRFQFDHGIILDSSDKNVWVFGPITREKMKNAYLSGK